jgi:FAD/FMN-containing dehydrogenase
MQLTGWGRYPRFESAITEPDDFGEASQFHRTETGLVARGNGRAYGDAAVGLATTLSTRRLDRIISFDPVTGRLEVEAGAILADILDFVVPRGFFPPVVPGTKFVSIGGMLAADVHGKNHHVDGGFGRHVESFALVLPDGSRVTCSPGQHGELFKATVGGMGLTGTILSVAFRLRRIETAFMQTCTIAAENLDAAMAALEAASDASYSVAWIDGLAKGTRLGRALVFRAEHARADALPAGQSTFAAARKRTLAVPFDLPSFTLNRISVAAFNELYFRQGAARAGHDRIVAADPYFFPLDAIAGWNRIYGARGFVQYQCVIPKASSRAAFAEILERVSRLGTPSFLAVLKLLGPGDGLMSFPMEGFTLALDFPVSVPMLALLDEIDKIVAAAGGRLYLAKDARQKAGIFEQGYAQALPQFQALRRAIGAAGKIESRLSRRLSL